VGFRGISSRFANFVSVVFSFWYKGEKRRVQREVGGGYGGGKDKKMEEKGKVEWVCYKIFVGLGGCG